MATIQKRLVGKTLLHHLLAVVKITAHGNVETAVKALKLGAFDFISKPVDLADLRKLVDNALRLGAASTGEARLLGESPEIN
ncbi:MAG TPA: response regulator, partial [Oceanospirillaceae bacterium]|nr:response regulator [Oceanospirillaceae bacterium]